MSKHLQGLITLELGNFGDTDIKTKVDELFGDWNAQSEYELIPSEIFAQIDWDICLSMYVQCVLSYHGHRILVLNMWLA